MSALASHDRSRPWRTRVFLALVAILALVLALALAPKLARAAPSSADGSKLQVAVKHAPPFSTRGPDGEWTGISVELWRELAAELGLDYELRETTLDEMLRGLAEGRYDVAVAALTVTAAREELIDFTHPFYTTGLAIAVPESREPAWDRVLQTVFSPMFLQLIAVLALIQLTVGALVWALERRANPEQFPEQAGRGIASGFWWAIVTMTTVGYGDKAPKSALGRSVALVWMLASMVILASVTATIASSLTVERLDARLRGPEDLHRFEVGVIRATTGESFLRDEKIVARDFASADEALRALSTGEIEALVWDAPLLRAVIQDQPELEIELVPGVFQRQDYAIAVREGSELRERINRALPDKIRRLDL